MDQVNEYFPHLAKKGIIECKLRRDVIIQISADAMAVAPIRERILRNEAINSSLMAAVFPIGFESCYLGVRPITSIHFLTTISKSVFTMNRFLGKAAAKWFGEFMFCSNKLPIVPSRGRRRVRRTHRSLDSHP